MAERGALRLVSVVALTLLVAAMAVATACGGTGERPTAVPEQTGPTGADVLKVTPPPRAEAASAPGMPTAEPPLDVEEDSETPKVTISGSADECAFEPSTLSFTLGETVTVEVTAQDDDHSFIIQGLGVSEDVAEGETVEVTLSFLLAQQHHVRCNADEGKGGEAVITVKALGL